jgi:hypothetical protein
MYMTCALSSDPKPHILQSIASVTPHVRNINMTAVQRGALRFCRQIALSTKPEASFERDSPTFFEQSALQAAASLEVWSINRRSSWASSMIASFVEACCHFTTLREIDTHVCFVLQKHMRVAFMLRFPFLSSLAALRVVRKSL